MSDPLDHLLHLLDLEPIETNLFRGANPGEGPGRVFGGQVASQALRAAQRTVDIDHAIHSLHSYFMRPGEHGVPILYKVERLRDGRSFTTRRVTAIQHGEAIFILEGSFHVAEDGPEYALPAPADLRDPDDLPARDRHRWSHHRPVDIRESIVPPLDPNTGQVSTRRMWIRSLGSLPDDDPGLHACVLTYASDMGPVGAARRPHEDTWADGTLMSASLDHIMWFHRPVRADEWLLYDLAAGATTGARGLARGSMFPRAGTLALSVDQEAP
ncbi:MAG: acyl-CoA thioesterase, partial [Acidimicrobiales bacterium]